MVHPWRVLLGRIHGHYHTGAPAPGPGLTLALAGAMVRVGGVGPLAGAAYVPHGMASAHGHNVWPTGMSCGTSYVL